MTPGDRRRTLTLGITSKIGIPLVLGLIALVSSRIGGMSGGNSIELAALVALGFMLVLFIIDVEVWMSGLHGGMAAGFQKIDRFAELAEMMNRSFLGPELLTDLLEAAGAADSTVSPLLKGLARRELERATWFVRQLPVGGEIGYAGEDREWLLGLTEEAQRSIDAISLSTVDAGLRGFDGGLWTSDLGARYLDLQREAIARKVLIRRIFVFENDDLAGDETFQEITQIQRVVGVEVRMLDHQLIPDWLRPMIFDFIIFDGELSYETTPATSFNARGTRAAIVRTVLAPTAGRVRELQNHFEELWEAARPDRQISA
jgi:hypothetical protein